MRPYYSLGTARYESLVPAASLTGRAVRWLLAKQNAAGTWGGPDALDELISTIHALMALFAVGVAPDSPSIRPALSFLAEIDKEKHLAFYWRSGVFLNLPSYQHIVVEDAEYIWKHIGRVAVHKDYPLFFFLLKLIRFGELEKKISFSAQDVLSRILADWAPDAGWYGRTSITTMALGLIYDLDFPSKDEICEASQRFVLSSFRDGDAGPRFHDNIVDDAFLVFNLAEGGYLKEQKSPELIDATRRIVDRLIDNAVDGDHWRSAPPFGGSVSTEIYPTAVIIRALLAFHGSTNFLAQVSGFLIDANLSIPPSPPSAPASHPIWGAASAVVEEDLCFVLMPFSPKKLGEIFERYVRTPIETELNMRCIRADDILTPTAIMRDVWEHIAKAKIIVAELTNKNANVFYELGMAHVLGKDVILIAQSTDHVPFDLSSVRCILYEDGPSGYEVLAETLCRTIRSLVRS